MIYSILTTVFLLLSILHVYWAVGGKLGKDVVVPSVDGKALFQPSPLGTIGVAIVLFVFAVLAFKRIKWGIGIVGALFFLRAIGEFRYVGFFKRVRNTPFALWDDRLFSPLCLVISFLSLLCVKR